jgi:propionyl-CoA carboxylase alpha chain
MEARVYAEDPARNFLPSIGRLVRYREPAASDTVRIDTGVVEGAEISMFYDPMIAKLVTTGATREAAIAEMRRALDAYYIRGIGHNLAFLSALLAHPRFQAGDMTTNFIAEEFPEGYQGSEVAEDLLHRLLAVAALVRRTLALRDAGGRGGLEHYGEWIVVVNDEHHPVTIEEQEGHHLVTADGEGIEIEGDWHPGAPLFQGRIAGEAVTVQIYRNGPRLHLTHGGFAVEALVLRPHTAELARRMPKKQPPDLSKYLLSPMPGLLVSLAVAEGQEVKAGQELAVVEAMKMENLLRAEQDGTVAKLHAAPGDSLAVDQKIVEFQ